MSRKIKITRASCHCGLVQFDIHNLKEPKQIIRCNCSICSKSKGFGMVCVVLEDVRLITGKKYLSKYVFKTNKAPHFFCKICGIHTHHKSRNRPDHFCINVACLDGLNIKDHDNEVVNFEGRNHPRDS